MSILDAPGSAIFACGLYPRVQSTLAWYRTVLMLLDILDMCKRRGVDRVRGEFCRAGVIDASKWTRT